MFWKLALPKGNLGTVAPYRILYQCIYIYIYIYFFLQYNEWNSFGEEHPWLNGESAKEGKEQDRMSFCLAYKYSPRGVIERGCSRKTSNGQGCTKCCSEFIIVSFSHRLKNLQSLPSVYQIDYCTKKEFLHQIVSSACFPFFSYMLRLKLKKLLVPLVTLDLLAIKSPPSIVRSLKSRNAAVISSPVIYVLIW